MIKPLLFTYLAMIVVVLLMDRKHLKQAAAINRWMFYGFILIGLCLWFYLIHLGKTFFLTVWLAHWIERFLPIP